MNIDDLTKPFNADEISYRVGNTFDKNGVQHGSVFYYMDARAVEDRLDDVVGFADWQVRYPFEGCCEIGIRVEGEWIWKANGAGETDFEGIKGRYSDSKKRAATEWGIGRYLYSAERKYYPVEKRGKTWAFSKPTMTLIKKDYNTWINGFHKFKAGEKDEILKQVRDCLFNGDEVGLKQIFDEYQDNEVKLKVWSLFTSTERASIKALLNDEK